MSRLTKLIKYYTLIVIVLMSILIVACISTSWLTDYIRIPINLLMGFLTGYIIKLFMVKLIKDINDEVNGNSHRG